MERAKAEALVLAQSQMAANYPGRHVRFSKQGTESLDNNSFTRRSQRA